MKIYTKAGDLAFKFFSFPDRQPHFNLFTNEVDFKIATIETAIRTPEALFRTLQAIDTLRSNGYSVKLDIRYLMGARMDRRMSPSEPFTLDIVARLLNGAGLASVRILDPHSKVATDLIYNSVAVLPYKVVRSVLATIGDVEVIIPDKGATDRVTELTRYMQLPKGRVQCYKERDPATGRLSNFVVESWQQVRDRDCLIIDDICDGGGTFTGLATELRKHGAKKIYLYVTHGIFSKGLPIEGIDAIYTTDSYHSWHLEPGMPVGVPISMKEL